MLVKVLQRVQLLPGAMQKYCIAGLQGAIGQLSVIGLAGLMDGQGIQAEGFTEADFSNRFSDEARSG